MTNQEKADLIQPWINPDERVSVDFTDVKGLNAMVEGCTENVVHLIFQESFPHVKERVTLPLRLVTVDEDPYHYTRDPDTPIRRRLRLQADQKRPDGL